MAPFDRNIVRRLALVIVLKGVFISCMAQTEPSNVCNSDDTLACRYDCPPESIQEHCTSGKEKDGYCCPGHFRTNKSTCQVCPGAHVMPDVNNCRCSCLLCAECPRNDTIKTRCSITTDTVCYRTEDQTPRPHAACPWIKTSSAPTTQVLTTHGPTTHGPTTDNEKVAGNTSDPQGNKSVQPYKGGFYTFMVLFILLIGLVVLICCCLCCYLCYVHHYYQYAHHSGGTDESDAVDNRIQRTWTDVAIIVAEKIRRTCAACRAASSPEVQVAGDSQVAGDGQVAGESQVRDQVEDLSNCNGHDEPDERGSCLPREEN